MLASLARDRRNVHGYITVNAAFARLRSSASISAEVQVAEDFWDAAYLPAPRGDEYTIAVDDVPRGPGSERATHCRSGPRIEAHYW